MGGDNSSSQDCTQMSKKLFFSLKTNFFFCSQGCSYAGVRYRYFLKNIFILNHFFTAFKFWQLIPAFSDFGYQVRAMCVAKNERPKKGFRFLDAVIENPDKTKTAKKNISIIRVAAKQVLKDMAGRW